MEFTSGDRDKSHICHGVIGPYLRSSSPLKGQKESEYFYGTFSSFFILPINESGRERRHKINKVCLGPIWVSLYGVNFINVLLVAFAHRSQKCKKRVKSSVILRFWDMCVQKLCVIMLMQLKPGTM